ncbi:hypothetical protein D083_4374 [Dickeya solani RNS 08.23.3.1.A]|nr:hypothetical protein D083_4374 [Dickeya solani RNS 08.23.3.1.A]
MLIKIITDDLHMKNMWGKSHIMPLPLEKEGDKVAGRTHMA